MGSPWLSTHITWTASMFEVKRTRIHESPSHPMPSSKSERALGCARKIPRTDDGQEFLRGARTPLTSPLAVRGEFECTPRKGVEFELRELYSLGSHYGSGVTFNVGSRTGVGAIRTPGDFLRRSVPPSLQGLLLVPISEDTCGLAFGGACQTQGVQRSFRICGHTPRGKSLRAALRKTPMLPPIKPSPVPATSATIATTAASTGDANTRPLAAA